MARLARMDAEDFDSYIEGLIRHYAAEHVRTGRWSAEEGPSAAAAEVRGLLPAGRDTPNHFLFSILGGPNEEKVGVIWLAVEPRGGFVYDLEIFEAHRRRGYAEEAMRLVEDVAREHGAQKISLHVFADNPNARSLYMKLGYSETNVVMSKSLSP
jgi:ribosomal protein S18 acetylase RimI-like enzyme